MDLMSELDQGQNSASCQTKLFELSDSLKKNLSLLGSGWLFGSSKGKKLNCFACGRCPWNQWYYRLLIFKARQQTPEQPVCSVVWTTGEAGEQSSVLPGTNANTRLPKCLTLGCFTARQAGGFGARARAWSGRGFCANEPLFLNGLWSAAFLLCFKIADSFKNASLIKKSKFDCFYLFSTLS